MWVESMFHAALAQRWMDALEMLIPEWDYVTFNAGHLYFEMSVLLMLMKVPQCVLTNVQMEGSR